MRAIPGDGGRAERSTAGVRQRDATARRGADVAGMEWRGSGGTADVGGDRCDRRAVSCGDVPCGAARAGARVGAGNRAREGVAACSAPGGAAEPAGMAGRRGTGGLGRDLAGDPTGVAGNPGAHRARAGGLLRLTPATVRSRLRLTRRHQPRRGRRQPLPEGGVPPARLRLPGAGDAQMAGAGHAKVSGGRPREHGSGAGHARGRWRHRGLGRAQRRNRSRSPSGSGTGRLTEARSRGA